MLPTNPEKLREFLAAKGLPAERILLVSRNASSACENPDILNSDYPSVARLEFDNKLDLGIAIQPAATDVATLSRMRDLLCRRVLLVSGDDEWQARDLLALGFVALTEPASVYLYDPDLLEQPRQWNNASNWANPENFDKYRW